MTQEEKDLILKDLCARLQYGVKIDNMGEPSTLTSVNNQDYVIVGSEGDKNSGFDLLRLDVLKIEDVKPYLFPLSSMTEEQYNEYTDMGYSATERGWSMANYHQIDWFNKNHFDYRGLIEKGLAINATNLNIY